MTPHESRAKLVKVVDATVEALPVGGWKVLQSPYLEECSLGSGKGVRYTYARQGGAGTDPASDVAKVKALWEKFGVTVAVSKTGGETPITFVTGEGGPIGTLEFLADPRAYGFFGSSVCVPGDAVKMLNDGAS